MELDYGFWILPERLSGVMVSAHLTALQCITLDEKITLHSNSFVNRLYVGDVPLPKHWLLEEKS